MSASYRAGLGGLLEGDLTQVVPIRDHRIAAGLVAAMTCLPGLVAIPFGTVQLPLNPSFLPAFGSVTFFADLLTAILLFTNAHASRDRMTAFLASAYLFSGTIIVPHLLAFPGVFSPTSIIGGSASAVWLWCAWHGGFALLVLRYAVAAEQPTGRQGQFRAGPFIVATWGIVAVLTTLATVGLPLLPAILVGNSYARLNTLGIGPAVVASNVAALAAVVIRFRLRSVLSVWLAVAMLAATIDTVLTLFGGGRFTLGWYVARCLSMTTGFAVLIALLSELTVLFNRTVTANRALQMLSLTDPLTGIANRRAFDRAMATEWRRAQREELPLSLLMIDIDQFKSLNDQYGHPEGDACLRRVAAILSAEARRAPDLAARIGGEEFALLLPGTQSAGALRVATLLHDVLRTAAIVHADRPTGQVTISIGLATAHLSAAGPTAEALLGAADAALYVAKQSGRDQTALAGAVMPEAQTETAPSSPAAASP